MNDANPQSNRPPSSAAITVCALYHFVRLPDFETLKPPLLALMEAEKIRGTLLLASEGINGTVAGSAQSIETLLSFLTEKDEFKDLSWKLSFDTEMPFYRSRVKLKKEIVTMGVEAIDPNHIKGTYISPQDWNDLISDPDVTLIDTRNDYEVGIGTFKGAINPNTKTFREFPQYAAENLNPETHKKVAMFCTGGIRCEKSTAFLKEQGFDEVYHLEGGILKYLEEVPQEETLWEGECFVFDNRVAVNHQLEPGSYEQCHACRRPITQSDMLSNAYQPGVSCPHCIEEKSSEQQARFKERQRQIELSKKRGEEHLGSDAREAQQEHKLQKNLQKSLQKNLQINQQRTTNKKEH